MILDVIGQPTEEELECYGEHKNQLKAALEKSMQNWKASNVTLEDVFEGQDPQAIDLLKNMLTFDHSRRVKV